MSYLPTDLLDSLSGVPGFNRETFEQTHQTGKQVTSIRVNPFKKNNLQFSEQLRPVPWTSLAYYLSERPSFTLDPFFHAGMYYVQEASSMFLEQALSQALDLSKPLRILDLCAAPGGKSTHILSLISPDSLLVSNEIIRSRAVILEENITKWGTANTVVTSNDPADFQSLDSFFDCLVVDAPCSGSGLFRKDPSAVAEWSLDAVNLCSQRQQRILADVLPGLKPGGVLIYSTCSYSAEEDEAIADWLIEHANMESIPLSVPAAWNIIQSSSPRTRAGGFRFYPDQLEGEGFYLSVFRKRLTDTGGGENRIRKDKKSIIRGQRLTEADRQRVLHWIELPDTHELIRWQDSLLLLPGTVSQVLSELQSSLYIKKAGTELGTMIRDEFIPSHALAMSVHQAKDLPFIELDEAQALQYLRRADLNLSGTQKGWILVTYRGEALGWIKQLANRTNNYYPREWRILNK